MSGIGPDAMECRSINDELDRGAHRPSANALKHLLTCGRCRGLYRWMIEAQDTASPEPLVNKQVRQQIVDSMKPVTRQSSPVVLALRFFLVFSIMAMAAIMMTGAPSLSARTILMSIVLACGAAAFSLSLAWQMSPGSLRRYSLWAAVALLCAAFATGEASLFPWFSTGDFWTQGAECLRSGITMAIPAGVVFGLLARRGFLPLTGALGATLGGIGGALGASVLQFACRRQEAGHLTIWHGAVLVVSIVVGIALASLFRRMRLHRN